MLASRRGSNTPIQQRSHDEYRTLGLAVRAQRVPQWMHWPRAWKAWFVQFGEVTVAYRRTRH